MANEASVSSPELKNPLETGIPEGYVALSFDDGPSKFKKEIIDILMEHQVPATFFFIGKPSGGVYLFHENRRSVAALPKIVEYLKEADVEFVVLK